MAVSAGTADHARTDQWLRRLVAAAAALLVLDLAWVVATVLHPMPAPALGWLPVWLSGGVAGTACVLAGRRGSPSARRFWRRNAFTLGLLVLASLSNARDALAGPVPATRPGPVTMALYDALVLVGLWEMLRLPIGRRSRAELVTIGLDAGVVMVSGFLVYVQFVAHPAGGMAVSLGGGWAVLVVAIAGLAGVVALVKMVLTGVPEVNRRALLAMALSVVVAAGAASLTPLLARWPLLNDCMICVPPAMLGFTVAALLQFRGAEEPHPAPAPGRLRAADVVPYVSVAVTAGVLLVSALGGGGVSRAAATACVVTTVLVAVRQLIAMRENRHLVARLDASLLERGREEQRFRSLVMHSTDITSIVDDDGRFVYMSPAIRRSLGHRPEDLIGMSTHDWVHPDDIEEMIGLFIGLRAEPGATVSFQCRLRHRDGQWRWFAATATNLREDPAVGGIVTNGRDITDTRRYQDELAFRASHDELTGLANRTLFRTRTAMAARDRRATVALVDLDDFKGINDRLGHAVGDGLLRVVGERMHGCLRPGDLVARLGGDEFGLLLLDIDAEAANAVAERIIASLTAPIAVGGHDLLVQASIGLADGTPGTDPDDLLRRADVAMYAAKELGKSRYVRYDRELDARRVEHAELAGALSQALDRDELFLLYQPIVDLCTGRLVGVESLVRWVHGRDGMISPVRFIPVAERTGQIVGLGAWILRTACVQAAEWRERYGPAAPARISVNVSARQLLEPAFAEQVALVLAETGLPASRLVVEITETAVFHGGQALRTVHALRALGVGIALDDFGTGHSSLGLLRTCPVDVLKVDKSFIDGVTGTREQEAIATSLVEIAQALALEAVAEGVETRAQADRLILLGYRLAQGFHFARPLPPQEVELLFAAEPSDGGPPAARPALSAARPSTA